MVPSSRPSGTVTFLFTDVEGSTRLWDAAPEAMRLALARHDAILRETIAAHGGWAFKTVGDAFFAAFPTAPAALNAAVEAYRRLRKEPWPDPLRLRVRMAIHTGAVESRDDDYFGPPLNRIARLLAAGHGDQILLSEVVQELVRDTLPEDVGLRSLGEHHLRDLVRPEYIYQALIDGVIEEFPPLRTLDSPDLPNNLPIGSTSFVGRTRELAYVLSSIGTNRLTTLLGSGGCGKTRLALQAAADALEEFPDGAWFVDLAPLTDPALVPGAALAAIGISEQLGESPLVTLVENVRNKKLLLVLDNCEHLVEACARLANELLRVCREVKILATSREALGIAGERTLRVPSLSTPDPAHPATVESLSQFDAVRLFVERATQHQPAFVVTNENAPAIAQLCHRLDGIPLALELAAARVRSLPVEEVNRRLDNLFHLLTGGDRTALPRQQTLRAAIDWSFELLTSPERALLQRLGVFSGGWTLEAAEQVTSGGAIQIPEVLDGLTSLVDKSLVLIEGTRYRMLETIRQYARDRMPLDQMVESAARHAHYYRKVIGIAGVDVGLSPTRAAEIERDIANVRVTIDWMLNYPNPDDVGHWIAVTLLWLRRGYAADALVFSERLLTVVRTWPETFNVALLLIYMGAVYSRASDGERAAELMEEGIAIGVRMQDDLLLVHGFYNLSDLCWRQGWSERGIEAATKALEMSGVPVSTQLNLGNNLAVAGEYERARELILDCLPRMLQKGRLDGASEAHFILGWIALHEGRPEEARAQCQTGVALGIDSGDRSTAGYSIFGGALVQAALDRYETAAILLGLHDGIHRSDGTRMPAVFVQERAELRQNLIDGLGEELFYDRYNRGEAAKLEEALPLLDVTEE